MDMKIIISLISAFLLTSISFAQVINFPDVNFKNRLLSARSGNGIAYLCNGNSFKIDANDDGEIDVSEALMVCDLAISNSNISDLTGIEFFTNLQHLQCNNNFLTELDLSPLTQLVGFDVNNNNLTNLNVTGLTSLHNMSCSENQLTFLNIEGLTNLQVLYFNNNQISSLNLNERSTLTHLKCKNNLFSSLDVSDLSNLRMFDCSSNGNLETIFIKNGSLEVQLLEFSNNPNLKYICADPEQLNQVEDKIAQYGYTDCFTNSICSYIEGGDFFKVLGNAKFDENEDGCDPSDINFPNLRLSFSDGIISGDVLADESGDYHYNIQAGTYTIAPQLENSAYYSVSPASVSVTFPSQSSPFEQDFCIAPNGVHPDLDVIIEPTDYTAYPGLNTSYIITYRNKGTLTQSGSVHFSFDDDVSDYFSSNPTISGAQNNLLIWDFTDLKPFETREIEVTLYINSTSDMPPLNEGDILNYTATLITSEFDETPSDNTFALIQIVSEVLLNSADYSFADYFSLYPNPTDQFLYLMTKMEVAIKSIDIYNLAGQLVQSNRFNNGFSPIDVTMLQSGNYFIKVQTNKGVFNSRFVKR